jgi:plastocyanin
MAIYYVNASTGNDANAGTVGAPWLTMNKATTTVAAGDTVNFTGTFNETLNITTTNGTETAPIILQNSGTWTIDAQNTRSYCIVWNKNYYVLKGVSCTGAATACMDHTAAHTFGIIMDCTFSKGSGAGGKGWSSSTFTSPTDIRIMRCTFNGFTTSPFIYYTGSSALWEGNQFVNCATLQLNSYSGSVIFIGNRFYGGTGDGLQVGTNMRLVIVKHNSFYGYTGACIKYTGAPSANQNNLFEDNIFSGGTYAIDPGASSYAQISIERNAFYNQSVAAYRSIGGQIVGDITLTANPYTNPGSNDLSLNNTAGGGALCRNAGQGGRSVGALEPTPSGGGSTFMSRGLQSGGRL